jgi:D-sedoheptulose 7-phosphate isomerase
VQAQQSLLAHADLLQSMGEQMAAALRAGQTVFVFGNGGSASQAQHLAAELVGRFENERGPLRAIALGTDPSILTAVGNDYGYVAIFRRQLQALARPGDVAIALSTSGASPNVLEAVRAARTLGLTTFALTAAHGHQLLDAVDLGLGVASTQTARIQEVHLLAIHLLCEIAEQLLFDS